MILQNSRRQKSIFLGRPKRVPSLFYGFHRKIPLKKKKKTKLR